MATNVEDHPDHGNVHVNGNDNDLGIDTMMALPSTYSNNQGRVAASFPGAYAVGGDPRYTSLTPPSPSSQQRLLVLVPPESGLDDDLERMALDDIPHATDVDLDAADRNKKTTY
jgi:hypothetical protein